MLKLKISSKIAFIISGLYSSIFIFFSLYKAIILLFVKSAMEDTFVGGETSDISITLWFLIAGVMTFTTFIFFYFLKIKDLKSQKIIMTGTSFAWLFICIIQLILFKEYFYLAMFTLIPLVVNYMSIKTLKNDILRELNKKGLSEKEIHLLQLLAGIKKK
ncbi:hypothetical protein [Candidatus Pelagibacter sp.]|uniref:hypothetical protein n=1 Tax=Candidatus Pelagibacter sp. TaxID=2024849 RepID=UPI003F826278